MSQKQAVLRLRRELARRLAPGSTESTMPAASATSRTPAGIGLLRGHVDEPTPGAGVDRTGFVVRGWCAWGRTPAVAVAVALDGSVVGRAAVGSAPRPDVADALDDPDMEGTGWEVSVAPTSASAPESAELGVWVWGAPGDVPVELDHFPVALIDAVRPCIGDPGDDDTDDVLPADYLGRLDQPDPDGSVAPVFLLRGWVTHACGPVSRLEVTVDGVAVGLARLGLARPDIQPEHAGPDAGISGFEYWVDLTSGMSAARRVTLQLIATPSGGQPTTLFSRAVTVAPGDEPRDRAAREHLLAERRAGLVRSGATSAPAARRREMNLIVFTHQLDFGGGQLWLEEFLRRSGAGTRFACTVVAYRDGALRQILEERGVTVHVTDSPSVEDIEQYRGRISELSALLAKGGHTVALVNTAPVFSGAEVAHGLSIPTVWAVHESLMPDVLLVVAFGNRVDPAVGAAARSAMLASAAVVFEAEATRQMYAAWEPPDRSIVVRYGVDMSAIGAYRERVSKRKARADVGLPADQRIVLVMGTVEERKSQTRIAQAFSVVSRQHPGCMLVFVGDVDSPYAESLKRFLTRAGLQDRSRVAPVDEDAYRWYRAADLLLSASDMESLPRSMLEAMGFGTAVVSASVFGIPDLIEDGVNGFLFEPSDLDSLIGALRRVLDLDRNALEVVGEAGRCHVAAHYDSDGYVADLTELLEHYSAHGVARLPDEVLARGGRRSKQ